MGAIRGEKQALAMRNIWAYAHFVDGKCFDGMRRKEQATISIEER